MVVKHVFGAQTDRFQFMAGRPGISRKKVKPQQSFAQMLPNKF